MAFALAMAIAPQVATAACDPASATPLKAIATAGQPAVYYLTDETGHLADATALELTVRPTEMVEGDSFSVEVFAGPDQTLLGTFSLFGARRGQPQVFVVNPPSPDDGRPVELTMKLLPAHPAGDLGTSALELVEARIVP